MILKHKDDLAPQIAELERLIALPSLSKSQRDDLLQELRALRAGAKGEKDAAYHIDFGWKDGKNSTVIHDLRIEHDGRVAQIDHLILMRTLDCHILETKAFGSDVRISERGEWESHTRFGWQGIPSPVEQNRRHIEVLQAFVRDQNLSPKRLGLSLPIRFHNWVLVSPKCQVRRGGGEWDHVVKMDLFETRFGECAEATSFFDTLSSVSKLVSLQTLEQIAQRFIEAHTPAKINFAAKFGLVVSKGILNTTTDGDGALSTAKSVRACCEKCSAPVDAQVIKYCRANLLRFRGKLLCRSCQQEPRSAASCSTCGTPVDSKVVAFCRFNSRRFGKKLLCRNCQTMPSLSAAASV